ncbi:MAG: TlpA family protein disulfide reductase [Burkholderiales bacterium]|nr:TlpA family protein disulfide reductase [Burkholderiales bacterium]
MRIFRYFAPLLAIAILAVYVYHASSPEGKDKAKLEAVLAATLPDLDGKKQAISQWRGKVLVVNFWASWCPPCRAEMPGFVDLQKKYGGKGLVFVGIALDSPEKAADYAKSIGVNYPILVDPDSTVLSLSGLPFTAVFDRRGNLVATHTGAVPEEKLEGIVGKLL